MELLSTYINLHCKNTNCIALQNTNFFSMMETNMRIFGEKIMGIDIKGDHMNGADTQKSVHSYSLHLTLTFTLSWPRDGIVFFRATVKVMEFLHAFQL